MQQFLKSIDLYGSPHNFTIFGKPNYQTGIGGILTLITAILFFVSFISFGKDFYLRQNPKYINQQYTKVNYTIRNISNDNFFLAIRTEFGNGTFFNFSRHFTMTMTYSKNNKTATQNLWNDTFLKMMDCNNYDHEKLKLTFEKPGTELFCYDFTDTSIGGYWESNRIDYFTIRLFPCFNSSNTSHCSSRSETRNLLSRNSIFVSLYLNNYYTDLKDHDNPLKMGFKAISGKLDANVGKKYLLHYKEANIITDMNILMSSPESYSVIGIDSYDYGSYLIDYDTATYNPNTVSMRYELYLGKKTEYFEIIYVKIQDIFASLGGIFNFIAIIIGTTARIINEHYKNLNIVNKIFDFNSFENEEEISKIMESKKKEKEKKEKGHLRDLGITNYIG